MLDDPDFTHRFVAIEENSLDSAVDAEVRAIIGNAKAFFTAFVPIELEALLEAGIDSETAERLVSWIVDVRVFARHDWTGFSAESSLTSLQDLRDEACCDRRERRMGLWTGRRRGRAMVSYPPPGHSGSVGRPSSERMEH